MKASANVFPKVIFSEAAAPATPAAGTVIIYAKTDGLLYSKDDAGAETALGAAGGANRTVVTVLTSTAGVVAINYGSGDYFTHTLDENVTSITFSSLPSSPQAITLMIYITQDAGTARTVAWPASFKWAGGVAGVVSTGLGTKDLLAITSFDQGTTWQATLAKAFA